MKIISTLLLTVLLLTALNAGSQNDVIIPKPQKLVSGKGEFRLDRTTAYRSDTPLSQNALSYLQKHLQRSSSYTLRSSRTGAALRFHYNPGSVKRAEGYRLQIEQEEVLIEARDSAGFFYGTISLLQLMEPAIWGEKTGKKQWSLPVCTIEDYPRFKWRGMMLDCSRNFFSKTYIKKFIDRMAQYKLNRFHWHLTDDEGWRIEIRHYPLLTKIGARRGPGTKLPFSTYPAMRGPRNRVQSGYYSQRDIHEIVAYAKVRSIEILPEIDIPGHAKAAVTAYPGLLLDPRDRSRYRSVQRISNNTINPGMKSSYIFMENVIAEVSALFPFGYIHLGGDEVPKGAWRNSPAVTRLMHEKGLKSRRDVQNYFFGRMDRILAKHGKKLAAWQEVIEGKPKLRKSSLIMAWKSPKAGIAAAGRHYPTIMAPVQYLYFDQQYVRAKQEPGHTWSTPVSLQKVYSFHPLAGAGPSASYIRGVHACLWSETLLNERIADYLAWPRALALSEAAWTEEKVRNWSDFRHRVYGRGLQRLKVQHIHYRKP